ncbi:nose resistant to fluoxetine protein 6-like [Branchiostoma floridae x Branchiostoma belcheri]
MKVLLYIFLSSAAVSLARSQAIWNRGVPDAPTQLNVLAALFRSQGLLQQNLADTVLDFSTANWTDISIPAQPTGNISQQCQEDVAQYEADLKLGKLYALHMLDAGGKPGSGILDGNLFWGGRYSQCVNITGKDLNITFDGKFYLATLVPVTKIPQSEQLTQGGGIPGMPGSTPRLTLGVCVPSSCTQHDVIQRLDGSIYWRFLVQQGILQVTSAYSQESPPIQNVTIAAICICGVLFLLLTSGTIYDVNIHQPRLVAVRRKNKKEEQEPDVSVTLPDERTPLVNKLPREETSAAEQDMIGRILLCFSVYTNIGKLLSTKQAPGSIKCLHGIRFISMTWVILGHTYIFSYPQLDNVVQAVETVQTFTFQAIMNATVSVDSFFFLSGLLMTYLLLRQIGKNQEKGKSVPYGMLYFYRYWRLTPTYMFVMMLYMWVLPYMFSGPFWPPAPLDQNCGDNWWTNILYINNLVNDDRQCMGWAWYLANDMQFFVIGVPLVYILYRWQILGIAVKLALLLASFITTTVISWHYNLKAPGGDPVKYYDKPYCRIGPYLVGVAVGWFLVKIKRKETKRTVSQAHTHAFTILQQYFRVLTKCLLGPQRYKTLTTFVPVPNDERSPFMYQTMRMLMVRIGWIVAASCAVAVLYSTYGLFQGTAFKTESEHVLYLTVHRTVWAMALGWVVVACYHGYGGVVDIILSWDAWVPLSRLTYCAYLVHLPVMYAVYLAMEVPIHYSTFTMIYFFLGHLTLSYGVAFLVSVAVEAPLLGLEKIIFNK